MKEWTCRIKKYMGDTLRKKTFLLTSFLFFIFLVSSCSYQYAPPTPAERLLYHNDLESVAVLPFLVQVRGEGDVSTVTEIFTTELARFRELNVVQYASVLRYLAERRLILGEKNIRDEACSMGKFFNVQSVLIGTVTEYDAFYPPVLGLSIELINIHSGETIATRSETYDSSFNYVRGEVKEYASLKKLTDSLYGADLILHNFDKYIRFVCYQFMKKYL